MSGLWLALVLMATPARLVSLAPSLTDLVEELGLTARLVGVSRFDADERLQGVARIGGLLDPDVEAIVRLKPDLVLALDGVAFAPQLRILRVAGLRVLPLRSDTLTEVRDSLAALGEALEVAPRARALQAELDGLLESARDGNAGKPRVPVAVAVGFRPLILAGRGSYLEPLLEAAGGENVVTSEAAWPTSSAEQLVSRAPAVLIDGGWGEEDGPGERLLAVLRSRGTRIVHLPHDLFLPGPRAIRRVPELARALSGAP